ncbi:hypothetical protein EON82_18795 [bacterium]|nr:MAG: hypothetical protein EON82_18795 [bacterium]
MRGSFFPGMPFNQQVSFPCELNLHTTPDGPRIYRRPIKELEKLQGKPQSWSAKTVSEGETLSLVSKGDLYRLKAEVEIPEGANLIVSLRGESVVLSSNGLVSGEAAGKTQGGVRNIDILLDRASIEAFVNDGELSSTRYVLPRSNGIFLKADGGSVKIRSLTLWPLKSIWASR